MGAQVTDFLIEQARAALARSEQVDIGDGLALVPPYTAMQLVLQTLVDIADLERAS